MVDLVVRVAIAFVYSRIFRVSWASMVIAMVIFYNYPSIDWIAHSILMMILTLVRLDYRDYLFDVMAIVDDNNYDGLIMAV